MSEACPLGRGGEPAEGAAQAGRGSQVAVHVRAKVLREEERSRKGNKKRLQESSSNSSNNSSHRGLSNNNSNVENRKINVGSNSNSNSNGHRGDRRNSSNINKAMFNIINSYTFSSNRSLNQSNLQTRARPAVPCVGDGEPLRRRRLRGGEVPHLVPPQPRVRVDGLPPAAPHPADAADAQGRLRVRGRVGGVGVGVGGHVRHQGGQRGGDQVRGAVRPEPELNLIGF